jgi:hypothetical protein
MLSLWQSFSVSFVLSLSLSLALSLSLSPSLSLSLSLSLCVLLFSLHSNLILSLSTPFIVLKRAVEYTLYGSKKGKDITE